MRAQVLPRRRPRQPSARERGVGYGLLVLLAVLLGLFAIAGKRPGPAGLAPPPAPSSPLPLKSPAGWPRGELELYDADSLFEKINGKADAYFAYEFLALTFASYARPDDPETYIDVYLYDMQTPLSAYGTYRAQRSGSERSLQAGDEACTVGASAFARKGGFYVEVTASGDNAAAEARALAQAIADALPAAAEPVRDPVYFPRDGLKRVRYVREACLGVEALTEAFLATYADGTQLVVAQPASPEAACAEARDTFAFLKQPARFVVAGEHAVGAVGARREELVERVLKHLKER
ncbi:MAG: DUF6599 family protein [Planctomycetota bacterium]